MYLNSDFLIEIFNNLEDFQAKSISIPSSSFESSLIEGMEFINCDEKAREDSSMKSTKWVIVVEGVRILVDKRS